MVRLAEWMHIMAWDPGDAATVLGCHEVWKAVQQVDDPLGSPKSARVLRAWLKRGFQGYPGEVWFVPAEPGEPGGPGAAEIDAWYRLGLPGRENRTTAALHIVVHPWARRRGIGTELLRHATQRALAHGRTLLSGEVRENSPGEAFAARAGAARGLTEVRRALDLDTLAPGQLRKLRDESVAKASGYSIVSWTGVTPDEYVDRVAGAHEAMNDAPHEDSYEPRAWDGQRVREDDAVMAEFGMRAYSVAALHDASGDVAALTHAYVDPEHPDWGHQGITAVTRPHRGHRLGLLVKTAMMEWLAEIEPALRHIDTGNAASNQYMIAVNETLGYRVFGPGWVSYEKSLSPERTGVNA
jgi:GNAT superfamily N-acetyltransferase